MPTRPARRSALIALVLALALPSAAGAATINVTSTADTPQSVTSSCTLRDAVSSANTDSANSGCTAGSGADVIVLPSGTYTLTIPGKADNGGLQGDLDIASSITLRGNGAGATTIDANKIDRAIDIFGGGSIVRIEGVTVRNGQPEAGASRAPVTGTDPSGDTEGNNGGAGEDGGGIRNFGNLTIVDSVIRDNVSGVGGTSGTATAPPDQQGAFDTEGPAAFGGIGGASGNGGGIASSGPLTISSSTITANATADGTVGGGAVGGAAVVLANGNGGPGGGAWGGRGGASGAGGGVYASGKLDISNSTISGNRTGAGGVTGPSTPAPGANGSGVNKNGGDGGGATATPSPSGGDGGAGGGIWGNGATTLVETTVSGNRAGDGGATRDMVGAGGGSRTGTGTSGAGGSVHGGTGGTGGSGGGVAMTGAGSLSVARSAITGNSAGAGGKGGNATRGAAGGANPRTPSFSVNAGTGGNGGDGGGLEFVRSVSDSTIHGNTSGPGGGAGLANNSGQGGSSFSGRGGNGGSAGAIDASELTLARSTVTANALGAAGAGPTGLDGTTGNGPVMRTAGIADVSGTIFAENGPDDQVCAAVVIRNESNNIDTGNTDCPGAFVDAGLGPLADNGGPTQTRLISETGPAVDQYACTGTDQRGFTRPTGLTCDIGAVELVKPLVGGGEAVGVTSSTATLRGSATPRGRTTFVAFDYGTTPFFGANTPPQTLAAGEAAVGISVDVGGLAPSTTYYYRLRAINGDATTTGPTLTFTTTAAPVTPPKPNPTPPKPKDSTPPKVTKADVTAPVFTVGSKSTPISAGVKKIPVGTTFKFSLSEPSIASLTITQRKPGKRTKNKKTKKTTCVPVKRTPSKKKDRCDAYVKVVTLTRNVKKAGAVAVPFTGRIKKKALEPGSYRVVITAKDASKNTSKPVTETFRIVSSR